MNIKSPLTNKDEVRPLIEAGANEFFCGIEPSSWKKTYKGFCINQRSSQANFTNFSELEAAISTAHKSKTKVHVAVNAFFYLDEQFKRAIGIIRKALDLGADGIIFADLGLLVNTPKEWLKNKDVVIGTDALIFNHKAANFYKRFGATRIVMDRAMTINEIRDVVVKDRSIEHEVFIINDLCFFVDGLCTYCKESSDSVKNEGSAGKKVYFFSTSNIKARGAGGGCRTPFTSQRVFMTRNIKNGNVKKNTFWRKKHIEGCGACALYDFVKMKIISVKVLDRGLSTKEKVQAVSFVRGSLNFLEDQRIPKKDYLEKCKVLFKQTFKKDCRQYDCYYPMPNHGKSFTHN